MAIGISTLCMMSSPFKEVVKMMERSDIGLWEIIDDGLHRLTKARVKALRELGKQYSVHSRFADVNLATVMPDIGKVFERILLKSLELSYLLEARYWVLHPGGYYGLGFYLPKTAWRNAIERARRLTLRAKDLGITVAVENMAFSALITDMDSLKKFVEGVGLDNIKVCLDTGHYFLELGNDFRAIPKVGELLVAIHVHDNTGESDEHLGVGEGEIDWRKLVETLERIGYRGHYVVEVNEAEKVKKSVSTLIDLLGEGT